MFPTFVGLVHLPHTRPTFLRAPNVEGPIHPRLFPTAIFYGLIYEVLESPRPLSIGP